MPGTVYALLVGINDYGGNPSPLFGCRADVGAMSALLRARAGDEHYAEEILCDGDATRERVIERFRGHLGRAGEGDVAVFMFSGHGSYEPVEERFWFLEPTGQNQTLVCADSRTKRAGDLADKELNELIREVADRGPHVLVLLDCCHSGGGTRDPDALPRGVRARLAPPATEPRPLETYLPGVRAALETAAVAAVAPAGLAHPRHVALSACEPTQLSKELPVGDVTRGAFSLSLERALTTLAPTASYRDVIGAAANAVRNTVGDQDPVLFVEGDEPDQPFLGGAVRPRPAVIALAHEPDGWFIDAGRLHGVQEPRDGSTTVLAVRGVAGGRHADAPLGHVRVTRLEPTRAAVEAVDFAPAPGTRYDAVVTEVPTAAALVDLHGDEDSVKLVRAALAAGGRHVREAAPGDGADGLRFAVVAADGHLVITRPDRTPITDAVPADDDGATRVVGRLDHLARWHEIRDIANPTSPLAGQLEIAIVPATPGEQPPPPGSREAVAPDDTGTVRLAYRWTAGSAEPPAVFVYVHNRSDRNLYCALLDMTDRYRSNSTLFAVSELAAGGSTVAYGGRPVAFSIPEERWRQGGTQVRDWLKLIASERRFDAGAFDLPILDGVLPDEMRWFDAPRERDAGEAGPAAPDWATAVVTVLTERPEPSDRGRGPEPDHQEDTTMTSAPADVPGEATVAAVPGLADDDPDDAFDADDPAPGETARGGALLQDLADVLREGGLAVTEVPGWKQRQRGGAGYSAARPLGIIIHHTASPKRWDGQRDVDYMTFECENKPLANLYLDRSGRWWVLAAGATNTNGKGGPLGKLPANGANSRVLGIEAGNDGIGEAWPAAMQDSYVRGVAALIKAYRIPIDQIFSHHEWAPGRKVDPAGPSRFSSSRAVKPWDMDRFRNEVAAVIDGPEPDPLDDVVGPVADTYLVRPGDTWWGIAEKTLGDPRRTWSILAAANGGAGRVLRPGDVLKLPGGGPAFPGPARVGDRGPVVRAWQEALIRAKVISDSPANRDAHYGDGMRGAVLRLQRSWGWSDANGTADERTWERLHR